MKVAVSGRGNVPLDQQTFEVDLEPARRPRAVGGQKPNHGQPIAGHVPPGGRLVRRLLVQREQQLGHNDIGPVRPCHGQVHQNAHDDLPIGR